LPDFCLAFKCHITRWIFARWHEQLGDRTIADGILDRLVHNAHRIEMRGESMRKKRNPPQDEKKE
jgi:DNA replication protein DnaC